MLKRVLTTAFVIALLVFTLAQTIVFCEEAVNMPIPQMDVQLNADGSSSMVFNAPAPEGDASSLVDYYSQMLSQDGYVVEASEDGTSMIVKKVFSPEEGYVIDLSLYGIGKLDFVAFNGLFTTKYGIKNSAFNSENQPEGERYINITVKTPSKPSFSNALIKSGNSNTWEIVSGSKNEIYLTFTNYKIIPIISTIFALAVLILLLLVYYSSRKKKDNGFATTPVILDAVEDFSTEDDSLQDEENPIVDMEFDVYETETEPEEDPIDDSDK